MKKLITLTLVLFLSLCLFASSALKDYHYQIDNGKVSITAYIGSDTEVGIPSVIEGYDVTSIADKAFYGCSSIKALTLPNGLTSIGDYAFYGCSSLNSILLPKGVVSIGDYAFSCCDKLTSIRLVAGNTVFVRIDGVLYNQQTKELVCCPSMKNSSTYAIADGYVSIAPGAFSLCNLLSSITIPASLTTLDDEVFALCSKLQAIEVSRNNPTFASIDGVLFNKKTKELVLYPPKKNKSYYSIPDNIVSVKKNAFKACKSLIEITIPKSLILMENGTFNDCKYLSTIAVDPDNKVFTTIDDVLFNKETKELVFYPWGKNKESYTIPNGILAISEKAFYGCYFLTFLTIPESVVSISSDAFDKNSSIQTITVTKDSYAARYCKENNLGFEYAIDWL